MTAHGSPLPQFALHAKTHPQRGRLWYIKPSTILGLVQTLTKNYPSIQGKTEVFFAPILSFKNDTLLFLSFWGPKGGTPQGGYPRGGTPRRGGTPKYGILAKHNGGFGGIGGVGGLRGRGEGGRGVLWSRSELDPKSLIGYIPY